MLKIVVDTTLCSGHARCNVVAGEIYRLDESGYCISNGDTVSSGQEELARRGARACPERAITLVEA
jgi:ferredoxin